jgi:hypothetical protein
MSKVLKKLKAIRRLVKNIPGKNIDLDKFVTTNGATYTDSVMCPAAWITTDVFVGKGLYLVEDEHGLWKITYRSKDNFEALAEFLGVSENEAGDLFGPVFHNEAWGGYLSHKKLFLQRIDNLIEAYK